MSEQTPAPVIVQRSNGLAVFAVILLVIIAAGGGYLAAEYKHWEREQSVRLGGTADGFLRVPPEITVKSGEPTPLVADTNGATVRWQPLDTEISLAERGARDVWVWGNVPGTYRLQLLAARRDSILGPELIIVKVEDSKKGDSK